jgi:hypothetical protein
MQKLKDCQGNLKCFKPLTAVFMQMVQDETIIPEQQQHHWPLRTLVLHCKPGQASQLSFC